MKIGIRLGAQTAHNAGELRKKNIYKMQACFFFYSSRNPGVTQRGKSSLFDGILK